MPTIQVAYLLEQCWHPVPGGTGVAAVGLARALADRPDIELVGLAARHRTSPSGYLQPPVPELCAPLGRRGIFVGTCPVMRAASMDQPGEAQSRRLVILLLC